MHRTIRTGLATLLFYTVSFTAQAQHNDIVLDKQHAIYWQDSALPQIKRTKDLKDAEAYCHALELDGLKGWRLPRFHELLSIVDYRRTDPAIDPVFTHIQEESYWTSTYFSATNARAWTIDFRTGKPYYSYTTTNHAVRCVKDLKTTEKDEK